MSARDADPTGWDFWIDRGGTFTDIVARDPGRRLHTRKLLSEQAELYSDAAIFGIREILRESGDPQPRIASVRMGTTVATNALLERRGAPTALVVTAGLGDVLRIGTQQRPSIFALDIELPEVLYSRVVEAIERVDAAGGIVEPLDEARLSKDLRDARAAGITSVAIVLLHGFRYPAHERLAAAIARDIGFEQVSVSHRVSPTMRIVPRGDTTLVDAYLTPVLRRYVDNVARELESVSPDAELLFMQSHGGLVDAAHFAGKDSLMSGPAGGIVGMASTALEAGFRNVIGFDMGGTSTDVSLFSGEFMRTTSTIVAGVRVAVPMLAIHTVAAGGGSIVKFESGRLQVGPESAGAYPGPTAYRNHGPLTITDANVLLGRIQAAHFPAVFGETHREPLDTDAVRQTFALLAHRIERENGIPMTLEEVAEGALEIAIARMAEAIRQISIKRGIDVADFVLASFGGAGGQHACRLAEALGVSTVLIHPLAGVLSAYGIGIADLRVVKRESLEIPLRRASREAVTDAFERAERRARAELETQRARLERVQIERRVWLKLDGSDTALPATWSASDGIDALVARFEHDYRAHFGFAATIGAAIIVEAIELEAIGERPKSIAPAPATGPAHATSDTCRVRVAGGWHEVPLYQRAALGTGFAFDGPALVVEPTATTLVAPGWRARVDPQRNLILEHRTRSRLRPARDAAAPPDPALLEVLNHAFMAVAEQMGLVLQSAAHSVNIKERMDFSCAVFDSAGGLIANAPHVPVHLGSMGATVKAVLEIHAGRLEPGSAYVSNDPYRGGTHLPDVTVVTPVHGRDGRIDFIVASRAHHADIGGKTPGSMPAASTSLGDEGVVIECLEIVRRGTFLETVAVTALSAGPYPARDVAQNIVDLKAQIAANARGAAELSRLDERFGAHLVRAYVPLMYANAEQCVRNAISTLRSGRFSVELDAGESVSVAIRLEGSPPRVVLDFTGTSAQSPTNLNAPVAVTSSAVLYAFRTLVDADIPLNSGCLAPIDIRLPEHSLLNPVFPAAVAAGNVETSQRIVDAIFGALGVLASSQGTMNNLTFGNSRYQYYETLCGGAGASARAPGASAVHTHMTNSRLTDPEVLEWRYPVRVHRFTLRPGSGGEGRFRGGDGVVREIEFLDSMHVAILSNCRRVAPFGLAGGRAGAPGRNTLIRASGARENLGGTAQVDVSCGDRIVIETPGGGGFGVRDAAHTAS